MIVTKYTTQAPTAQSNENFHATFNKFYPGNGRQARGPEQFGGPGGYVTNVNEINDADVKNLNIVYNTNTYTYNINMQSPTRHSRKKF
jgi:hypothetical protein